MRRFPTTATLLLAALAGCGSEEDRIPLAPVTGTVTAAGEPVPDAVVTFLPDASNPHNTPGSDLTGPEGTFSVKWGQRQGLSAGRYHVTVAPKALKPEGGGGNEAFKNDPYMAQLGQEASRASRKKADAPREKEFDADVTATGGTFSFDLAKDGPPGAAAKR